MLEPPELKKKKASCRNPLFTSALHRDSCFLGNQKQQPYAAGRRVAGTLCIIINCLGT